MPKKSCSSPIMSTMERWHRKRSLKVLTNEIRGGLRVVLFDRSPFKLFSRKFSYKSVQAPSCESPKATQRTLFLLFANNNWFPISDEKLVALFEFRRFFYITDVSNRKLINNVAGVFRDFYLAYQCTPTTNLAEGILITKLGTKYVLLTTLLAFSCMYCMVEIPKSVFATPRFVRPSIYLPPTTLYSVHLQRRGIILL
jgi:hypothetical protein